MNKGCREDPRTMPVSKEYAENHERIFGQPDPNAKKGGRYKMLNGKLVLVGGPEDCGEEVSQAKDNLSVDRFREGDRAADGTDISSRAKLREYKRRTGVTEASDYGPDYSDRVKSARDRKASKNIEKSLERSIYKHFKY